VRRRGNTGARLDSDGRLSGIARRLTDLMSSATAVVVSRALLALVRGLVAIAVVMLGARARRWQTVGSDFRVQSGSRADGKHEKQRTKEGD
jgi:hypothetical protein